jgi:RNA polymerase sigma factor (TIGR02999 family)
MPPGDLTAELSLLQAQGPEGWSSLSPRVYGELRRLAAMHVRRKGPAPPMQPTELVHEAYLRLVRQRRLDWQSRTHFYGVAAHLMRLIMLDCGRRGRCSKRGGPDACRVSLSAVEIPVQPVEVDGVSEAIERLSRIDPRQALIVDMRYFGGLTVEETAEALGVSPKTVKREWTVARAWLHGELRGVSDGA